MNNERPFCSPSISEPEIYQILAVPSNRLERRVEQAEGFVHGRITR